MTYYILACFRLQNVLNIQVILKPQLHFVNTRPINLILDFFIKFSDEAKQIYVCSYQYDY